MTSKTQIVNLALTLLGEDNVLTIEDDIKSARVMRQVYDIALDSILGAYNWSFAMSRQNLAESAAPPPFGFSKKFALPPDCLRIVMVGDLYVGVDLSDYRDQPTAEYLVEGRDIHTDWAAPLKLRYVKRVTDTVTYSPVFVEAFSAKLAMRACHALTQSGTLAAQAEKAFKDTIKDAIRANAIELPPQKLPDDEWTVSRL